MNLSTTIPLNKQEKMPWRADFSTSTAHTAINNNMLLENGHKITQLPQLADNRAIDLVCTLLYKI